MKDAYYFPHDCNARNDQKLIAVRAKHGMKGYGIYFGLIEMLREANGYQISSKINLLAFDLREEENDIKDVLENYDLFETDGVIFWSPTLLQRMKKLTEVRETRRLAGKVGGLAKARNLLQQKSSKTVAVKESKVKESKVLSNIIADGLPATAQSNGHTPTGPTKLPARSKYHIAIDLFLKKYTETHGVAYIVTSWPKITKNMKPVVDSMNQKDFQVSIDKFFESNEAEKVDYSLDFFISSINKWRPKANE